MSEFNRKGINYSITYSKSCNGEYCFSLSVDMLSSQPVGFCNVRMTPKELKKLGKSILKVVKKMKKEQA
jgi:hypothetical protein